MASDPAFPVLRGVGGGNGPAAGPCPAGFTGPGTPRVFIPLWVLGAVPGWAPSILRQGRRQLSSAKSWSRERRGNSRALRPMKMRHKQETCLKSRVFDVSWAR